MRYFVLAFLLLCLILEEVVSNHIHQVPCNSSTPVCECGSEYEVCEFNFTVEMIETFTRYKVNKDTGIRSTLAHPWYIDSNGDWRPIPGGGRVCQTDDIPLTDTSCTEPISVDGYTFRYVIAVNDRVPGPTLIVNQHQLVKVNVYNRLFTDTISIHWHGMRQVNTNWMDGAGGLTQCGIKPYSRFTYIFNATQYGTHWWHSHSGTQRTEGLYGGFIVKQRSDDETYDDAKVKIAEMTGVSQFQDLPSEHTLLFSDWFKTDILADAFTKTRSGLQSYLYTERAPKPDTEKIPFPVQETPDGSAISFIPFWSGLINGKGRHESVDYIDTRLSVFTVSPGQVYRFRFIGAQMAYSYRVSIDEHKLVVVATDGEWIEPVAVDYLIVFSGERYDVLVDADQTSKNDFIIRAETLEIDQDSEDRYLRGDHYAEAILHYDRADPPTSDQYESISSNSIPVATRCTDDSPCLTLNCPFTKFPVSYNVTCMNVHQLRSLFPVSDDQVLDTTDVTDSDRLILNFNFEGSRSTSAVNGRHFIAPSTPFTLLNESEVSDYSQNEFCKNLDNSSVCDTTDPGSADCVCPHVRTITGGRTIQLVISNIGPVNFNWYEAHPIHFHGHHFRVVDVQYGDYDDEGYRTSGTNDIDCGGSSTCTTPKWKTSDPYADIGEISRNAPLKDTLVVPGGGYAVVYFKSDNPGWWLMACHILDHFFEGMGVTIYETGDITPPPSDFHVCGNYDFTVSQYERAVTAEGSNTDSSASTLAIKYIFVWLFVVIVAMLI